MAQFNAQPKKRLVRYVAAAERGSARCAHSALLPDFPGCLSASDVSMGEALENLKAAARLWLDAAVKRGQDIPEPSLLTTVKSSAAFQDPGWEFYEIELDLSGLPERPALKNSPFIISEAAPCAAIYPQGLEEEDSVLLILPSNAQKDIPPLTMKLLCAYTGISAEELKEEAEDEGLFRACPRGLTVKLPDC